jgi:hypothetical protein
MISISLGSSRKLSELPAAAGALCDFCQALYPLIVVNCDDFGRMDSDAFTIKHRVFPVSPHSETEFEEALRALAAVRLIVLYVVQGKRYLQVTNFDEHQSGLHKRTKSRIPEPPLPEIPGNSRPTEPNRTEQKRTEQKGNPPEVGSRQKEKPTLPTNGAGRSKFSLEQARAFAESEPNLKNREGFARKIYNTGSADDRIAAFLGRAGPDPPPRYSNQDVIDRIQTAKGKKPDG